jgi:hypothetical protein
MDDKFDISADSLKKIYSLAGVISVIIMTYYYFYQLHYMKYLMDIKKK